MVTKIVYTKFVAVLNYHLHFSLPVRAHSNQILGKRVMHFKVCSCPKRDMSKEMNTAAPPRKRPAVGPPSAGKQPSTKQLCVTANTALSVKSEPPSTPATLTPMPLLTPSTGQSSPASQFGGNSNSSPTDGGNGDGGDANVTALSTGIDSFKFEAAAVRTPDTLPMMSPPPPLQPQPANGFGMNFVMPTRESAQHVLRCAYNEVTGSMARDRSNSMQYIPYARQLGEWTGLF